jgi:broad specificity phosphatase PhoE
MAESFFGVHKKTISIAIITLIVGAGGGYALGQRAEKTSHEQEHAMSAHDDTSHDHSPSGGHGGHAHANAEEAELINKIKSGGYVLFARHDYTQLDKTKDDMPLNFDNCSSQRQLSEAGKLNSKEVGQVIANLGIKIEKAYTSPYCRTVETSQNMFGTAEKVQALSGLASPTDTFDFTKAGDLLKDFMKTVEPTNGNNIAVTAHWGNFKVAYDMHIGEGDIAVLQKDGDGYKALGVIHPGTWRDVTHDAVRAASDH